MTTKAEQASLDPDEPHTPIWFTLLGLGLFLLGGIFLLATDDGDELAASTEQPSVEGPAEPEAEGAPAPQADEPAAPPTADPHAGHGH